LELNGEAVLPIHEQRPPHKALSSGGNIGESTAEPLFLFAWLVRNLERLIEELDFHEVRAGRLTVWVAYKDGQVRQGQTTLAVPSDRYDVLLDAARPCLRRAYLPRVLATRMHLIAERLAPRTLTQLGLFDSPPDRSRGSSGRSTSGTAGSSCGAGRRCRCPRSTAKWRTALISATWVVSSRSC
jgi:hypothetical protein